MIGDQPDVALPNEEDAATIVAVVRDVDPDLETSVIRVCLAQVCPIKIKRRRLAATLAADPGLLTRGWPDGPLMVDRLIEALIAAGSQRVTAPRCPLCGSQKAVFTQFLDGRRVCQSCYMKVRHRARPCSTCGSTLNVNCRDRAGQPVCRKCRPGQNEDPVALLLAQVAPLAPGLPPQQIEDAIRKVHRSLYALLRLSWEIEDNPALLTGDGAQGSSWLMRLLVELERAGASGIIVPACPGCSSRRPLKFRGEEGRICRHCYSSRRPKETCTGCGQSKAVAIRADNGEALCSHCSTRESSRKEECIRCHRSRPVERRTPQGPLCTTCYRLPTAFCSICGRHRPCFDASSPTPRCPTCSRKKHPCLGCGRTLKARARTPEGYLCQTCYAKDPVAFRTCTQCGLVDVLYHHGLCHRCACRRRASELLSDTDGQIRPGLEPVVEALADAGDPGSILKWLSPRARATEILKQLGRPGFPVEHDTLDQFPPSRAVDYLRGVLVTAGALPRRDERMLTLSRWIDRTLESLTEADDRRVLAAFARWHELPRLRQRLGGRLTTGEQVNGIRQQIREAARLLQWLRDHGTELSRCDQGHIDEWLFEGTSTRQHARPFVKWAVAHHHAHGLEVPAPVRRHPAPPLDDQKRIEIAQRLLTDASVALEVRVAGLLMAIFAQSTATIVKLRVDQVLCTAAGTHLELGREPLHLPGALGDLIEQLADSRRPYSNVGRSTISPWLFPGRHPEIHLSSASLLTRLKELGIYARATQHSAMVQLTHALPESVINRLLGISIESAERWKAGGEWGAYAAAVARRGDSFLNS